MLGGTAAGDCPPEGLPAKSRGQTGCRPAGRTGTLPTPPSFAAHPGQELVRTEEGDLSCLRGGGLCSAAKPGHLQQVLLSKTLLLCAGPVCTELLMYVQLMSEALPARTQQQFHGRHSNVCCMIPLFCTDK